MSVYLLATLDTKGHEAAFWCAIGCARAARR